MAPGRGKPSIAELVHAVLRAADRPLGIEEIVERVSQQRTLSGGDPRASIRNALGHASQLVSVGEGRHGYLPHLIEGSLLRLPLVEPQPATAPLVYPEEVCAALFPSCFDTEKGRSDRPARLCLPDGHEVELTLEAVGRDAWGSRPPDGLQQYLAAQHAASGDALLIRVMSGEVGTCEVWFEAHQLRDQPAVALRNRELADAAEAVLRDSRTIEVPVWQLCVGLLARGAYRSAVAPDPLEQVLEADARFVKGFGRWLLAKRTPRALRSILEDQWQGLSPVTPVPRTAPVAPAPPDAWLAALLNSPPAPRRSRRAHLRPQGPLKSYQLKVTLRGIRPPIWRRLLVGSHTSLGQLHSILQVAMGWEDDHLHQFVANGVHYGVADDLWGVDEQDEDGVSLAEVLPQQGKRMVYEYDFGDSWKHDLLAEKVLDPQPGATHPVCIAGQRSGAPEDVGGIWGYAEFLRVLADPDDPEHAERLEWVGGAFDPEQFDADAVNVALRRLASRGRSARG